MIMDILDLEEALDDIFPSGYSIDTDSHGQLIIFTNLTETDDGELETFDDAADEDFDPDLESLVDDGENE